jgi:hypothetical protein
MRSFLICSAVSLALFLPGPGRSAGSKNTCAVTKQPSPPFVPPAGYPQYQTPQGFWYGSDSLWTMVSPHPWRAGGNNGAKLTYYRRGFDSKSIDALRLTVVGRRVDGLAPLVWSDGASSSSIGGSNAPGNMAMVTGIDIPTAGCWEISAHYVDQTLIYTIRAQQ